MMCLGVNVEGLEAYDVVAVSASLGGGINPILHNFLESQ